MTTAELVTAWRTSREGLTKAAFARAIGTTRAGVWSYENGTDPPMKVIAKMAAFFEVTVAEFFAGPPAKASG